MDTGFRGRAALLLFAVLLLWMGFAAGPAAFAAEETAPLAVGQEWKTFRGVSVTGRLQAEGQEGEPLRFVLLEMPSKGAVELEEDGLFTYTPAEGKSGRDRFTFTVEDAAGNCSAPAAVTLEIQKSGSVGLYRDMEGHPEHAAALQLAERGIFIGNRVGENYYFDPDRFVSRSEFLVMAMTMAEVETLENVMMTGFCDDAAIPVWAKGYVSAALKNGIVEGCSTAEGPAFCSADTITTLEAATVLNRILQVADAEIGDGYSVPEWAAQAVANMESVQVVAAGSFGAGQLEEGITRAEAARMLSAAMEVLEKNRRDQDFFDWLF